MNKRCMHNEEGTCMEILLGPDNTTVVLVINYHHQFFSLPASSDMVSSPNDVPDVSSAKRITRFHTCVFFAIDSVLNGYLT